MSREAPVTVHSRPMYPTVLASSAPTSSDGEPSVTVSNSRTSIAKTATRIAAFVSLAALGLGLVACFSGEVHSDRSHDNPNDSSGAGSPAPGTVPPSVSVDIDASQALTTTLGDGVGIFVEYDGQGTWRVWTSCDTNKSGATCGYDLYATADKLQLASQDKLEGSDFVDVTGNTAHMSFDTSTDSDGATFTISPGTPLDLEVYLDAEPAQQYVYWVGDGNVNSGAPANPVEFTPH